MTFPKYPSKIGKKAIFSPSKSDFVNFPTEWIIIYYGELLNYIKSNFKVKKLDLNNPMFEAYQYKNMGIAKCNGVGSPHASIVLENLISNGGKVFLNIGSAAGLDKRGVFLVTKSLRDEGTSYHYLKNSDFSFPNKGLTKDFAKELESNGLTFESAINWTIDSYFRETPEEVKTNLKKNIKTVEMEVSALFAVARYRRVKIASALVVRDTLIKERKDFIGDKDFFDELFPILETGIKFLEKMK